MRTACLCILLVAAAAVPAGAEEEPAEPPEIGPVHPTPYVRPGQPDGGTYSVQWENDRIANTDRNYTNGLRFAWISGYRDVPEWVRRLAQNVPFISSGAVTRIGATLGQSIYTPEEISRTTLIRNDRPYAGWLYGGVSIHSELPDWEFQSIELDFGVVGPGSMAAETQNLVHRIIDAPIARGWEHQLRWEPGIVATYEYRWLHLKTPADGFIEMDLTPHVGGAAGNIFTYGAAGATLRVGEGLRGDFGPPRVRPALPGSTFFEPPTEGFRWYLFGGAEGRAVARNIFLDGNTFRSSHSVDKNTFVVDFQVGAAITYSDIRLAFTHVWRTPQFEGQRRADRFGAVSLSWRF